MIVVLFLFIVAVGCMTLYLHEKTSSKIDNLEALIAHLAAQLTENGKEEKPTTFEDIQKESMEKIFTEWTNEIVNYNPYRKDDD